MAKIQILVTGRNEEIVQTIVRLINSNSEWNASFALTDEDAVSIFKDQPFDLVLLGGGINPESDILLREEFTKHNPHITIIQHYGGGSGLLATEINMALSSLL